MRKEAKNNHQKSYSRTIASYVVLFSGALVLYAGQSGHASADETTSSTAVVQPTNSATTTANANTVKLDRSSLTKSGDPSAAGWTEVPSGTESASTSVTRDGKNYTLTMNDTGDDSSPLFSNSVTGSDGVEHTYSFLNGSSDTSAYYVRTSDGTYQQVGANSEKSYTKDNGGQTQLRKDVVSDDNVTVSEVLSMDAQGQFNHEITFTNNGTSTLSNVKLGTMLDTMLDNEDDVTIYSDGNGGIFMKNDAITLFSDPITNTTVYAGEWNGSSFDIGNSIQASNNYGEVMSSDTDTAIEYESAPVTLAPGASSTFSYTERLYTDHEQIGQLVVHYVSTTGEKLQDDSVTADVNGTSYSLTAPEFSGYTLTATPANATGTYNASSQEVTFVYRANNIQTGTVTVNYVDGNGNALQPSTSQTGGVGETYTVTAPEINGYELASTDGNAQGTYASTPTNVTFVYDQPAEETPTATVTPDTTVPTVTEVATTQPVEVAQSTPVTATTLPKTGDAGHLLAQIIGVIVLGITAFTGMFFMKQTKK